MSSAPAESQPVEAPALVQLRPGVFQYWAAGEFIRDGKPVVAPHVTAQIRAPVFIMKHQVSV